MLTTLVLTALLGFSIPDPHATVLWQRQVAVTCQAGQCQIAATPSPTWTRLTQLPSAQECLVTSLLETRALVEQWHARREALSTEDVATGYTDTWTFFQCLAPETVPATAPEGEDAELLLPVTPAAQEK